MRTRIALGAAAFAVTTAFLAAPSAMAGFTEITIDTKGALTPGQQVKISAVCYAENPASKVVSEALEPVELPAGKHSQRVSATTRIRQDTKPGTYTLSYTCAEQQVPGTFKVVAAAPKPAAPKTTSTQVAEKPKGAAETGGGQDVEPMADVVEEEDPIQDAAPAPSPGPGTGVVALGGAGVLAAGGAGFLLFRRSRRRA